LPNRWRVGDAEKRWAEEESEIHKLIPFFDGLCSNRVASKLALIESILQLILLPVP